MERADLAPICLATQERLSSLSDGRRNAFGEEDVVFGGDVVHNSYDVFKKVNGSNAINETDVPLGEWTRFSVELCDEHLLLCAVCTSFQLGLVSLQRLVMRVPSLPLHDITDSVMLRIAELTEQTAEPSGKRFETNDVSDNIVAARTLGRTTGGRRASAAPAAALCIFVTAIAQIVGAIPHLFAVNGAVGHLSNEAAAFEIALAAGFIAAVFRPAAVSGIRVTASVLTAFLVVTTGFGVARSSLSLPLESHHVIAILGSALLWVLPATDGSTTRSTPRIRRIGGLRSM